MNANSLQQPWATSVNCSQDEIHVDSTVLNGQEASPDRMKNRTSRKSSIYGLFFTSCGIAMMILLASTVGAVVFTVFYFFNSASRVNLSMEKAQSISHAYFDNPSSMPSLVMMTSLNEVHILTKPPSMRMEPRMSIPDMLSSPEPLLGTTKEPSSILQSTNASLPPRWNATISPSGANLTIQPTPELTSITQEYKDPKDTYKRHTSSSSQGKETNTLLFTETTIAPTYKPTITPGTYIRFAVMGDTPYKKNEAKILQKQLKTIPHSTSFIYHLGDLQYAARTKCNEDAYIRAKKILLRATSPVFVTPGDNDWNDCPDPVRAWEYWEKHFYKFDDNWKHSGLNVRRMVEGQRRARASANVAWFMEYVLFVGVNLVGGSVQDANEWKERLEDDLEWTLDMIREHWDKGLQAVVIFGHANPRKVHENYFNPLKKKLNDWKIHVAYIHGDGHDYFKVEGAFGVRRMTQVQVDRGGFAPPLMVTVHKDSSSPFKFDRQK
eukprot:CAMPEP_0172519960 /NCGR_PEP_ID=MMETSP1066-20121228/291723_1 /TAXON_ID=671091 /ORGANISM="Coscinodiscus wailesii, Strain CCMP2513" /LENGTH=493 /DNA_ID=CAMNT_0013302635 /DNA_START=131 /DNA_END=1612 /DNA_ORIENTATION=-